MTYLVSAVGGILLLLTLWWVVEKLLAKMSDARWASHHLGEESFKYWMSTVTRKGN